MLKIFKVLILLMVVVNILAKPSYLDEECPENQKYVSRIKKCDCIDGYIRWLKIDGCIKNPCKSDEVFYTDGHCGPLIY